MLLDGRSVLRGERWESAELTFYRRNKHEIKVVIPGRWTFSFRSGTHVDIEEAAAHFAWNNKTHGVLGQTLRGAASPTGKCNSLLQGGCEVEGDFRGYEVPGSLCSTSWLHGKFDESACE